MFNKNLRLIAIDRETKDVYLVESIHLPLGSPSGKDITVKKKNATTAEWKSINEVDIFPNQYGAVCYGQE